MYSRNQEKSKRIEYRVLDPTTNIYLLEDALLLAGLYGIKNKIDPGVLLKKMCTRFLQNRNKNIIGSLPVLLKGSLDSLVSDSNSGYDSCLIRVSLKKLIVQ
jgi:glutamine synthetase